MSKNYPTTRFKRIVFQYVDIRQSNSQSKTAEKIYRVFDSLQSLTQEAEKGFEIVEKRAHEFDFVEGTKSNGYWSLLAFARASIRRTYETVNVFTDRKESWFFNERNYLREIRYVSEMFLTTTSILNICKQILARSEEGKLILNEKYTFKELLTSAGRFNQYCLFGKFNSLQLSESYSRTIRMICKFQAAYSEFYYRAGGLLTALWRCLKIFMNEDQRGMRNVALSKYASPSFLKSFSSITEKGFLCFVTKGFNAITQPVSTNQLMLLEPEAFSLKTVKGDKVLIPVPTAHTGLSPLPVRLLSSTQHKGMNESSRGRSLSTEIVLHFHGGGFIAHTSISHEVYLRRWARQLNCPIVSVDYSFTPEAPQPRQLEEAFFFYCYALKNPEKFGWTGDKIVLTGDSAGGVLVMSVLQKSIQYNIRLPNGALLMYTPFELKPVVSPGRFLSFLDPVFSMGFLAVCLNCYFNVVETLSKYELEEKKINQNTDELENLLVGNPSYAIPDSLRYRDVFNPIPFGLDGLEFAPTDPMPLLATEDTLRCLPPMSLLTCQYDPFIDDNVELAKTLKSIGVETELRILEGLTHGFLNLCTMSESARKGSDLCCQLIMDHFRS